MDYETLDELLSEFADSVARVAMLREISRDGAGHGYIDFEQLSADMGTANGICRESRRAILDYWAMRVAASEGAAAHSDINNIEGI